MMKLWVEQKTQGKFWRLSFRVDRFALYTRPAFQRHAEQLCELKVHKQSIKISIRVFNPLSLKQVEDFQYYNKSMLKFVCMMFRD